MAKIVSLGLSAASPADNESRARQELDAKLKVMLPEEYQECYENVEPVSMGSASLKYDADGQVAWDEIWGSFCDLAMAGGPPHRGTLLEPGAVADIQAEPEAYRKVVEELQRGIRMVADLAVELSAHPGWLRVQCPLPGMAGWLARAIVMENVAACVEEGALLLPAGPRFRVEKEIKNVVTSVAKTTHYFADHIWSGQQRTIAELLEQAEASAPLLQPLVDGSRENSALAAAALAAIAEATDLRPVAPKYAGWLGVECGSVARAIWMMRGLVVNNVLARREETVLYVPVNAALDPAGERVAGAVVGIWRLAGGTGE